MRFLLLFMIGCMALVGCGNRDDVREETSTKESNASAPDLMSWADLTDRALPEPTIELTIGGGDTDVVDLWLPEGDGPHPVVLMVHGGCWQKAIADRTLMNYAAEELRQNGFAVWNVEYRGVDESGGGYPGTFADVALGADALKFFAEQYNLNTNNVIAYGHSAGGHLALWLAARSRLPAWSPLVTDNPLPINAVVNTGGLADLEASEPVTLDSCLAAIMDDLTGAPSTERENVFSDTSPAELLPFGVEQIAINGDSDHIAPPSLGKAYTAKAIAAGDLAGIIVVPDTGHVELISPGTEAFDRTIEVIKDLSGEQ
ncbi:MAG: alpha/beta hydrolase [Hyphomicrobiales bacterium]|nr:alpha/beta hydrolase [Hyphomicrobiales bacterium]